MWSASKASVVLLWWGALWTATCPRSLADEPLPAPNQTMSELQLLFPRMCKPALKLEQQIAALITESDSIDPCVRSCLPYSFAADRGALHGLAYYYGKKQGQHELGAPLKALCPGRVQKDGKTAVSEPSGPKKSTDHTSGGLVLSEATYSLVLPEGWGDDEEHAWIIGRPDEDFATMKMDRGYSDYRVPRYEERRVIHPKKHMHLRFPSLHSGTFSETMDADEYARPYIRVRVEACQCLTQGGCENYRSPRSTGMPQCTLLGFVETTPSGGFKVSCELLPQINGHPQPTACSFTGDGRDVVFTARDDGFNITVETPKTFASYAKEGQARTAIEDLATVARESCTYELANANKATACALENMPLIDFTRQSGSLPACCVTWEMEHAGSAINTGSSIIDGEYLTVAYYPTPRISRPRFRWIGAGWGQETHFCNMNTGHPTWSGDPEKAKTFDVYELGIKFEAKCNFYASVSVGNGFHADSANPEGGWSTSFFTEWIAEDGVPSAKAVQIEAGLKNFSDAVPVTRKHTEDENYVLNIPSDLDPGIMQPAKGYIVVEYKACGPEHETYLQGPACLQAPRENGNSTNSTNATLGSSSGQDNDEAAAGCEDRCCPCNITMVERLAHVVPGGFECSAPSSSMHVCTAAQDGVQITFYSDFGWEVVAVRFVYEMPVPPFGVGIAVDDVAMAAASHSVKGSRKKLLTGSIELKYFTVEVIDGRNSAPPPPPPPSHPPSIDEYCKEGLLGLIGRPCSEWHAATCPLYLQRLNHCCRQDCCRQVADKISEHLAVASSLSDCRRSDGRAWQVSSESAPPVCVPTSSLPDPPSPPPPPQPSPPPLILMPPSGAPSGADVGFTGGSGDNSVGGTGPSERCSADLCVTLMVALPMSTEDFTSEQRRIFRQAIANAAELRLQAVEISDVEAAPGRRRRLLQDVVHIAVEIITDNPKQAAAVAERLSEENVNNELEALGLPKGKVIQGARVATSLESSELVDMTGFIVGVVVGGACLLCVGGTLLWRRYKYPGEDDSKVDDTEFLPIGASPDRPITVQSNSRMPAAGQDLRDLPTWLDSPSAVNGNVIGSLNHDSDDDGNENEAGQDEDGFKEQILVDASPGEEDKENAVNGRRRRTGRRRARLSNIAGKYASPTGGPGAGWGEIQPFPEDEFDVDSVTHHFATGSAANGSQNPPAAVPTDMRSPSHVVAIEPENTLTKDTVASP